MVDLNYIDRDLEVKIVGQDSVGDSINYVSADPNGNILSKDVIGVAGQYRAQSVTTTAAEALGAATILVNRKMLSITPTNGTVWWGFDSSVTTTTGTPIFKNQHITLAVSDQVHIYLISAGTVDCRIAEGS